MTSISKKFNKSLHADSDLQIFNSSTTYESARTFERQYGRKEDINQVVNISKCDFFLSSWPKDNYNSKKLKGHTNVPFINIGYPRGLKAWQDYINKNINIKIEESIKENFFFWPLSVDHRIEPNGTTFDLFEPSVHVLKTLKEINYPLQVVFRNHPTTNPNFVERITKAASFTNFTLSNAHPQQLIRKSNFMFSQSGTSLFCDAWFLGKPIVQYVSDENRLAHTYGKKDTGPTSVYPLYTDYFIFLDKENFIEVLHKLEKKEHTTITRNKEDLDKRFNIYSREAIKNQLEKFLN